MAVKQDVNRQRSQKKNTITWGDIRLLFCTVLFFAAVLLKYANFDTAQMLRTQAAQLLHGGIGAEQVLEVFGKFAQEGGLQAVFADTPSIAQVFGLQEADTSAQTVETQAQTASDSDAASDANAAAMQAEGGYAEELQDRVDSAFPKTADEVAYMMQFSHVNPVPEAVVTSVFGARIHPISGVQSFHYGLDLAAEEGTPIGALADGTVRSIGYSSYGNYMIVDHADGFSTLYAHCSQILAAQGDKVTAGQTIARVGATGNATGNHLHLEVWRNDKALDPSNYVQYTAQQAANP